MHIRYLFLAVAVAVDQVDRTWYNSSANQLGDCDALPSNTGLKEIPMVPAMDKFLSQKHN